MTAKMPYTVQAINSPTDGLNYRITDSDDNRIGTCYDPANAALIVAALNIVAAPNAPASQDRRIQEIIFDMTFMLGTHWRAMHVDQCGAIMDHVSGSRGLFDRIRTWALAFDAEWEAKPEDQQENYYDDVDLFFTARFNELLKEATS